MQLKIIQYFQNFKGSLLLLAQDGRNKGTQTFTRTILTLMSRRKFQNAFWNSECYAVDTPLNFKIPMLLRVNQLSFMIHGGALKKWSQPLKNIRI